MKFVPVREADKKKSYYSYICEPWIPSAQEIARLTGKVDQNKTLEFADRRNCFRPDFVPEPPGCYDLKTGGIVISSTVPVPDITKEMMDWWMVWHQFDPLRYALWDPQDHYNVSITPEVRAQLLDDSIPMERRLWNAPCTVLESFNGEKPEINVIRFCDPAKVGYDESLIGTDECLSMICSQDIVKKGPLTIPTAMTEILRKGPDGTNIWVAHWWMGAVCTGGQDITKKIRMKFMVKKIAKTLIVHNQIEMTHLNKILPELYKAYGNLPMETECEGA
ncbi:MAG: hypothetical protein IKE31_01530 [Eubacterium sp.]|nr:hypothetical protein [Eubacterium sp.]